MCSMGHKGHTAHPGERGLRFLRPPVGQDCRLLLASEALSPVRTLKVEQDRLRQEFGSQYHDLGEHGPLVFCHDDGRSLNWENIARRDFRRIATRLKLPIIRPYEFGRHAHAAWLYAQGVHPTIISQRLGHSSTAFTMDTYGYLDRGVQSPVVAKLQVWLNENAPR